MLTENSGGGAVRDVTALKVCSALSHGGCQASFARSLCGDSVFYSVSADLGWGQWYLFLKSHPLVSGCHLRSVAIEFPDGRKNFHTQEAGVQAGPF